MTREGGQLGRIERPAADQYRDRRKLLLAPLVAGPPARPDSPEAEGAALVERYWEQVQTQVNALESGLGPVRHIFHESLTEGGEAGLSYLQFADRPIHDLIQAKLQAGAALVATESLDLLTETLDLQRCLMAPFTNEGVANRLQEWFNEANRHRYDHIAQQIDQTIQAGETGLLLISERHQVQFPADLEVFYIAPPALDEYRRWLQNWAARQQAAGEGDIANMAEPDEPG